MISDITYTFGFIGAILLVSNMEIVNMYIARWWEQNKNKTLNDLLMEALWNTSYAYTFVKYRCGKLYSTFPLVRTIHGRKTSAKPAIEYPCASITQLIEDVNGKLRVMESHFDLNDFEWQNKSISENLLKLNTMCKELLQNNEKVVECLLLVSENVDGVRSRVINRKNMDMDMDMDIDTGIQTNMSTIKFLLIDYVHPALEESYELVVNKAYFMEGNHILSGAFVGRLLFNQGYSGVFDKSYRTVIIDQEVKTVEWTYADFIEVATNKKYVLRLNEVVQPSVSSNSLADDDETKSWDKVDKE